MNFIDVLIVLFVLSSIFRGREVGFVRQLCSAVGFFGGLWLGAIIAPHLLHFAHQPGTRSLITVITTLGFALMFLVVGEYVGIQVKRRVHQLHIDTADSALGAIVAMASTLAAVWLSAAILLSLPLPSVQQTIKNSAIISELNQNLPSAPNVIADIGKLIDPNGFPQVFSGSEPAPHNAKLPPLGDMQHAVLADEKSVVKIQGEGCGGIVEGSGFVVGADLVATNAHVVAGIHHPYVSDQNGTRSASVIWFDSNLDFAVLKVSNLAGKPLFIDTSHVSPNTPGAVLGYPGGGNFTADSAVVLDEFTAVGRNIYGQGNTERDVYEIKATVIPGNSGGPLINQAGDVVGVVFAESTTYKQVGYALTSSQILSDLHQAEAQTHSVSTGNCAE
ncbi:MAG TPA: MarP family serine protease [Candidatus Saccharimonadales bacterium]|nr:MarP family serine protease [Candidatus Saccharimonadales bacterium]